MAMLAQRLPGVSFENVTSNLESTLPRMDIGTFVGFAETGPFHTPVAVESSQQFRDVFGSDVALAWNDNRGEWQHGQLGASVESFLRNGGRRCWVVRVADEAMARTAQFLVPRLVRVSHGRFDHAMAVARCPGSWAEQLQLRAILEIRQLRMNQSDSSQPAWHVGDDTWSASVAAPPEVFELGEVISLEIKDEDASPTAFGRALLIVEDVVPTSRGTLLRGKRGYWVPNYEPGDASAAGVDIHRLTESSTLGLEQDALSLDLNVAVSIARHRFELQAWTSDTITHRIGDLGFTPEHLRYWGRLPSDDVLFGRLLPDASWARADSRSFDDVISPRFPFAAEQNNDAEAWDYLPLSMPSQIELAALAKPVIDVSSTRHQRDGLERFNADHFVDRDLAWFGADTLLQEALTRTHLTRNPRPLRGIYTALLIDEATLLAAPDALHRQWDAQLPPFEEPLDAPHLRTLAPVSNEGWVELSWSQSSGSHSYFIEIDNTPSFPDPERFIVGGEILPLAGEVSELLVDPATDTIVHIDNEGVFFIRVRAEKTGVVSAWSNSRVLVIPPGEFFDCSNPSPQTLQLELSIDTLPSSPLIASPDDGPALIWHFSTGTTTAVDRYEVEEAATVTFTNDIETYTVTAPALTIKRPMPAARFYRVRAVSGATVGPWSNTMVLPAGIVSEVTLVAPEDYDSVDLLAVQRSMARICQARGDLFGVLSTPEHYDPADVIGHCAALSGFGPEPGPAAGFSLVQPLSGGEQRALSHLGMYYPWIIKRGVPSGTGVVSNRRLSPEGSAMGMIARRTLAFGAWIAPANEPFVDTLAVLDEVAKDSLLELNVARVNVIQRTPQAFLTLNEATLSKESEWQTIHVRRLMHLIRRLVLREGNQFVFEPNSAPFRDRVRRFFIEVLTDLYTRGALAGRSTEQAFRVVIDESVNDETTISRGRLIAELHVAPSAALKFMKVRLVQLGPSKVQVLEQFQ